MSHWLFIHTALAAGVVARGAPREQVDRRSVAAAHPRSSFESSHLPRAMLGRSLAARCIHHMLPGMIGSGVARSGPMPGSKILQGLALR
jgi:hypothetical protein